MYEHVQTCKNIIEYVEPQNHNDDRYLTRLLKTCLNMLQ